MDIETFEPKSPVSCETEGVSYANYPIHVLDIMADCYLSDNKCAVDLTFHPTYVKS